MTVAVHAEDPWVLVWLEEFLGPTFDAGGGRRVDCGVLLDTDPARHAAIMRRGCHPDGGRVASVVPDNRVATYPAWILPTVFAGLLASLAAEDSRARSVSAFSPPGTALRLGNWTRRP
jgi:hypothetical protein